MTEPIDLNEFRERRIDEESMASFEGVLRKFERALESSSKFLEPLIASMESAGTSRAHRRSDEPTQAAPVATAQRGWTTRDGVRLWTTRDGVTFTQAQIDAVIALIHDPERLVTIGFAPIVLEAAVAAGWKPPRQRQP